MLEFKKTTKYKGFYTNKDLDIQKLDEEIRMALGATRWENHPEKKGYSGITVVTDDNFEANGKPGKHRIIIHWTEDGKNGFNIDPSEAQEGDIKTSIANHIDNKKVK